MRNEINETECVAVIGSMTQAMRAQNVLAAAAIRTEVIKADSSKTGRGCAYGISYPCVLDGNVRSVLQKMGVTVRSVYRGGDA